MGIVTQLRITARRMTDDMMYQCKGIIDEEVKRRESQSRISEGEIHG